MHRGVLLQPGGQDEEETRVLARACLQQFGHGTGAEQALTLRDLRNRSAVIAFSHPSRNPAPKEAASTVLNVPKTGAILWSQP
jgi:hypothetical protein